mmetsp:Transcript_18599/g.56386  ORF Transcript_18599/g.56386 Transcript_18599/m.56386 type:complete len:149 (+) Transcript_18599:149-595(+)
MAASPSQSCRSVAFAGTPAVAFAQRVDKVRPLSAARVAARARNVRGARPDRRPDRRHLLCLFTAVNVAALLRGAKSLAASYRAAQAPTTARRRASGPRTSAVRRASHSLELLSGAFVDPLSSLRLSRRPDSQKREERAARQPDRVGRA